MNYFFIPPKKIAVIFIQIGIVSLLSACNNSDVAVLETNLLVKSINQSITASIIENKKLDRVIENFVEKPETILKVQKELVDIAETQLTKQVYQKFAHEMNFFSGENVLLCDKQEVRSECQKRMEIMIKQHIESYLLGFSHSFQTCKKIIESKPEKQDILEKDTSMSYCLSEQGYTEEVQLFLDFSEHNEAL